MIYEHTFDMMRGNKFRNSGLDDMLEKGEVKMTQRIFEKIKSKQVMNRVQAPSMPFDWSINPYRGCSHGCSFCYARTTHSFLGLDADDTFQNHIFIKENAADALERQLNRMSARLGVSKEESGYHMGLVAIGTATDPYQPLEGKEQVTRDCLRVLAAYQVPVTITTRSPLILRDLDILKEMFITSINISVNTLNREVWRQLEPASPFPLKRLETVETLVSHGLHAGIFLAPVIPFRTDQPDDLERLFHEARQHQAQFVMPSLLRLSPEVKPWFFRVIAEHYPHLKQKFAELYRSGYPVTSYKESCMKRIAGLMERYGYATGRDERDDWRKDWKLRQKQRREGMPGLDENISREKDSKQQPEVIQLTLPL